MMKHILILLILLGLLLFASSALAMSSTNYRLDWFTPMTTSGGGTATSAHYAVNLTMGQTVIGASSNPGYRAGLGYWAGLAGYRIYLPLVLK